MKDCVAIQSVRPAARRAVGLYTFVCLGVVAMAGPVVALPYKLTREESQTVPVNKESKIYVKNSRGKTIIVGRKGVAVVSIRAIKYVKARNADAAAEWMDDLAYKVETDGEEVSIRASHPDRDGGTKSLWSFIRGITQRASIDLTIEVPSSFNAKVASTSGDVQITSLDGDSKVFGSSGDVFMKNLGGDVFVEISSGDLEVAEIGGDVRIRMSSSDALLNGVGGVLNVLATSGDIEAYDVVGDARLELASGDFLLRGCGGDVEATTSSGDGVIESAQGNIRAVAASGDLHLTILPLGDRNFVVHTASGDVKVMFQTPDHYGFFLDVATNSGSIEGDLDIRLDKISRRMLRGVVGSGKSRLVVETASGDIKIVRAEDSK